MKSTLSLRRRMGLGRVKVAARSEVLEERTLMSAWGTVNTYSYPGGSPRLNSGGSYIETSGYSMAADSAGNLYAPGQAFDTAGTMHGIIQERTAGSGATNWATIEDLPNARFSRSVIDSTGDLIVTGQSAPNSSGNGNWIIAVQPAGQSGFTVTNTGISTNGSPGMVLDGSGNVFFDATVNETVNGVTQQHWVVEKGTVSQLLAGQSNFTVLDDFFYKSQSNPHNITYVPSGTAAGLYVAGTANDGSKGYWIVRKSADGGNTWSTIDNFVPANVTSATSVAYGVSADLTGNNLYVVGTSGESVTVHNKTTMTVHWIVRQSSNGGASWTVSDDISVSSGNATPYKVQSDQLGKMYVVGKLTSGGTDNAVVRANTGTNGSWVTVDNYSGGTGTTAYYYNVFVDAANNHYAVGTVANNNTNTNSWLIRTDASTTAAPAAVAAVFSSTQVSGGTDVTDLLKRKHRHG